MFLRSTFSLLIMLLDALALVLVIGPTRTPWWLWAILRLAALIHLALLIPILYYRFRRPGVTRFMRRLREYQRRNYGIIVSDPVQYWVDYDDINPDMKLAAIASEDILFPQHYGFDWESLFMAIQFNREQTKSKRGASTITQQMVKNLFLWPERTPIRKVLELYLTTRVEAWWPKRRILEMYLNLAQLGDAIFGVEAAARHLFGKQASTLTQKEAALLVTILPNPTLMKIDAPDHPMRFRQTVILDSMNRLGHKYLELM